MPTYRYKDLSVVDSDWHKIYQSVCFGSVIDNLDTNLVEIFYDANTRAERHPDEVDSANTSSARYSVATVEKHVELLRRAGFVFDYEMSKYKFYHNYKKGNGRRLDEYLDECLDDEDYDYDEDDNDGTYYYYAGQTEAVPAHKFTIRPGDNNIVMTKILINGIRYISQWGICGKVFRKMNRVHPEWKEHEVFNSLIIAAHTNFRGNGHTIVGYSDFIPFTEEAFKAFKDKDFTSNDSMEGSLPFVRSFSNTYNYTWLDEEGGFERYNALIAEALEKAKAAHTAQLARLRAVLGLGEAVGY
jgi:hypothetical protein